MTADTTWTDRSDAGGEEWATELARIEAAPAAEESFDATAALRRVMVLCDIWEGEARNDDWSALNLIDDIRAAVAGTE